MKFSFLVLYFIFAGKTWSQVPKGSVLNNKVSISCGRSIRCDHYKSVLVPRLKSPKYESQIKSVLSAILLEGDVEGLSYVWEQDSNVSSSFSIKIHFKIRPKIIESEIQIDTKIDVDALSTLLNIKAGSYLNNFSESDSENEVFKFMQDRGYYKSKVVFRKINFKGNLKLVIDITSGKRTLIRKVIVNSKKEAIKSSVKKTIKILEKSPYEILKLKEEMDLLKGRILSKGYYFLDFLYEAKWVDQSSKMVDLLVQIDEGPRLAFGFYGNKVFKTKELLGHVKTSVKSLGKSVQKSSYERILKEFYSKKGVHGTSIESYSIITKMKDGSKLQTFFFNIVEGRKILIKDLRFVGSGSFSNQKLKSVYYNQATVLALRDFYDQNYLEQFKEDLTRFYYKNGFVFFKVSDPYLKFDKRMESVKVEYLLSEGIQAHVDEINFEGLSQELINKVRPLLVNKRYQPLNIIALENDVKRLDTFVKDQGYIYSRLLSLKTKDLLKYKSDYRYADLSFKVQLGPLAILNNVILKGNKRTRDITILREVEVSPGDVVTPSLLREINNRINALGLFSKVEVSPVQTFVDNSSKIDLLINVQERDFGIFEVAPGFRTDIGLKLSSSVSYNNLSGKNRTVQFRGQVNQRLDFNTIDSQREANAKERLLEYSTSVKFIEPYLLDMPLGFNTSLTATRRRFFSFDANIVRAKAGITKSIGEHLNLGLNYQYETISQYDASETKDNDNFQIGSLTPSISLDFRDNSVVPRKGAFLRLSTEFANPYFFKKGQNDSEINFYKVVSRNAFYFPLGFVTLANSISFGFQENLADDLELDGLGNQAFNDDGTAKTNGRIPSIKVFRLNGIDNVRGFDNDEINRLRSGRDISEVYMQSKAYFMSIKIEPRFNISDSMMIAPFYDAGRVAVDTVKHVKLRESVGISLKIITPFGSLDFDYGVKLDKEILPDGRSEKPGKFHLSIGFF